MCGIAGFIGSRELKYGQIADSLLSSLAHRGPDGQGIRVIEPRVATGRVVVLAHRRLAIIDLSECAAQPMEDTETGNWIVYNGEIYNFQSLKAELEKRGVLFRSRSDTEVILKCYATEGLAALDRFCGMFALALWDSARGELVLAVDSMGIKPLYFWRGQDGTVLFASEVRALLATGLVSRIMDPVALESYLSYGAVQAPHTMIRGVTALLPGTYARVRANGSVDGPHRYWSPTFAPEDTAPVDETMAIEELRRLLREVVREHLISDVPLGAFLSGGIDSSSVVALMSEVAAEAVHTFSVTFVEQDFSEAPYSREIAGRYSTKHTEICLSEQDLLGMLPTALKAMDQPSVDGINVYVISRVVREAGVTVVLSGQGGDELFGGYPTFRQVRLVQKWRSLLRVTPRVARSAVARLWSKTVRRSLIPSKVSQLLQSDGDVLTTYLILRQLYPPSTRRALFPAGEGVCTEGGQPRSLAEELHAGMMALDPINKVSFLECRTYLANMLLRDGDVMSMAHSLEVRVPFLDRRLVDFVARIPGPQKVDSSVPKPLLVRAMEDLLPPSIYGRPKQGFTFPWEHWLRHQLRSYVAHMLDSPEAGVSIGLAPRVCQRFWHAFLAGEPGITWSRVWGLYVLLQWSQRWGVEARV